MPTRNAVTTNNGELTITGLEGIVWTAVSGGEKSPQRGAEFYDPDLGAITSLPNGERITDLVCTTKYSTLNAQLVSTFYEANKDRTDLVAIGTISDAVYTFVGCGIGGAKDFPGFDKNNTNLNVKDITLTLTVGNALPIQF